MTYFSLSTDPDDSSPRCAPKCSGKDCACRSDQFLSRLPNAKHVKMGGGGGGRVRIELIYYLFLELFMNPLLYVALPG